MKAMIWYVVLFATSFLCSPSMAQKVSLTQVLFCISVEHQGMELDTVSHKYKGGSFELDRFTLRIVGDEAAISEPGLPHPMSFKCEKTLVKKENVVHCNGYNGYFLSYNFDRKRYVILRGYAYLFGDGGDTISVSIGTCDKYN